MQTNNTSCGNLSNFTPSRTDWIVNRLGWIPTPENILPARAAFGETAYSVCVVGLANVVVVVGLVAAAEESESGLFTEEELERSDVLFAGIASGWSGASSSKLDSDSDSSAASSISSS